MAIIAAAAAGALTFVCFCVLAIARQIVSPPTSKATQLRGPRDLVLVGLSVGPSTFVHTLRFLLDPFAWLSNSRREHGSVFQAPLLLARTVVASTPTANRSVLSGADTAASSWPITVRILLGPNVTSVAQGALHARLRRGLRPLMLPAALASYLPRMVSLVREHLTMWAEARNVVAFGALKNLMFSVAAECFMGLDSRDLCDGALERDFAAFICAFVPDVRSASSLMLGFPRGLAAKWRIHRVLREKLQARRAALRVGARPVDVMQHLLDTEEFGDHETTTCALTCLLLHMTRTSGEAGAAAAAATRKARAEVVSAGPDVYDAARLPFLNAVLKEVLRLEPPVMMTFRKVAAPAARVELSEGEFAECSGAGVACVDIRSTHRSRDVWGERAASFDPTRMRVFASELLRGYEFSAADGGSSAVSMAPVPTGPRPVDGLPLVITRRVHL